MLTSLAVLLLVVTADPQLIADIRWALVRARLDSRDLRVLHHVLNLPPEFLRALVEIRAARLGYSREETC